MGNIDSWTLETLTSLIRYRSDDRWIAGYLGIPLRVVEETRARMPKSRRGPTPRASNAGQPGSVQ